MNISLLANKCACTQLTILRFFAGGGVPAHTLVVVSGGRGVGVVESTRSHSAAVSSFKTSSTLIFMLTSSSHSLFLNFVDLLYQCTKVHAANQYGCIFSYT